MKFTVDKAKAIEALVFIARSQPGIGRFHASKALYFAELEHLTAYGRPIFGDRYIAMDNGPVPSYAYDVLKGDVTGEEKAVIDGALQVNNRWRHPEYSALRDPDLSRFSRSDIECLKSGLRHVKGRSFGDISDETHNHAGWKNADINAPMSLDDMLAGVNGETRDSVAEFAAYGVL